MSTNDIPLLISKRKSPEIIPNTIMSATMGFLVKEIVAVNESPVFEPLKFYCSSTCKQFRAR